MRRILLAITLVATSSTFVALSPTAAHATDCSAGGFVGSANSVRAGQGLPPLEWNGNLASKAQGWAETMSNAGSIFHSNLPDGVSEDWYRLGENVGTGPDTGSIAQALINSPGHYANLVDPGFRYVGVGVTVNASTGACYVSEVFMELASQPAPTTSASAAGTPNSQGSSGSSSGTGSSGSGGGSASAEPATPPPPPPPPPPPARLTVVLERLRDLDG